MSGSLDDEHIQIIDTRKALLAILVYPDGHVNIQSSVRTEDGKADYAWVADTLRKIAHTQDGRASDAG